LKTDFEVLLKVFHLMSGAPYGGVEQQAERVTALLQQNGDEQRVMLADNPARAERFAAAGAITIEMQFPSRFAFLDRRRINGVVRRFEPNLLISWTPDVAPLVEKGGFVHLGRIGATYDGAALAKCDHLLAPTQARADIAISAGWPASRVHVLPQLPFARAGKPVTPAISRKTLYTPPTAKLVVTALRLVRGTGLETLLDAIARLSGTYLWIAGDGPDRAYLEAQAHEKGVKPRVRFLGWQPDLAPYVAVSDAFVYPARRDDSSDAIVEAWGAGASVISADSLGPGLLVKNGENGVLVPVDDAISMAEAIKRLCLDRDLAKKFAAAGRAVFDENYAEEKIAARYLELFKTLVAPGEPMNLTPAISG
jgi:glycosyltransferase involved in cell wall biosynthesis